MGTITFDTLAAVQRLREAGYEEKQAETIVRVIGDAQDQLVTKEHLDHRLSTTDGKIALLQWMIGFVLAFVVAIAFKLFTH